ncbi:MAG: hypothetical protein AAGA85_01655 [Bacteroidota bacterium]
MRHLRPLTFTVLLSACQLAVNDRVVLDDFTFDTTDPSELFFKNVRQSYYDLEERGDAKMNVFRLSNESRDSLGLYPVIIQHWAIDKAYLWLEPGAGLPEHFEVEVKGADGAETYNFDGRSPHNHLEVATAIFHGFLDEAQIKVAGRELMPAASDARSNFRIVANDYYRLVELK